MIDKDDMIGGGNPGVGRYVIATSFDPGKRHLVGIGFCAYTGPSMNPTLNEGDLLEVKGYSLEPIRAGDVLLFRSEEKLIVHRATRVSRVGIRTRGDNNSCYDPFTLDPNMVIGQVVAAWRGQSRRRISGGQSGALISSCFCIMKKSHANVMGYLASIYHFACEQNVMWWLKPYFRPSVVRFGTNDLRIMLGSREIGKYNRLTGWRIQPPFKLVIDEKFLEWTT